MHVRAADVRPNARPVGTFRPANHRDHRGDQLPRRRENDRQQRRAGFGEGQDAKRQDDLLGDPWTAPRRFRLSSRRLRRSRPGWVPFGPGFFGTLDEKSRLYFLVVSARWRLKSVEGLNTIAQQINGGVDR